MNLNIDYLENQSRRNNIRIDGIPELPGETWTQTENQVRETLHTKLRMTEVEAERVEIERAHRVGPQKKDKTRTVVLKLTKFKDREAIIKQAREAKIPGLYVNEDFSQRVIDKRKQLFPELKKARMEGKIAYLSYDRLVVRNKPPG